MRFLKVGLMVVATLLAAQLASATAFDPFNDRPVTINGPASGEVALQSLLNTIYGCTGCVSAANNQQSAGMWSLPGQSVISPILQFEYAGNAPGNVLGFWYTPDLNTPTTLVPIFTGIATGQNNGGYASATVRWIGTDTLQIGSAFGDPGVNVGTFTGIPKDSFGFYISGAGGTFFTVDALNGGSAQSVAYKYGSLDRWVIAFEDLPYGNADRDYNDLVMSVESVAPVPEPTSLLLLGSGLFGLGGVIRRKLR